MFKFLELKAFLYLGGNRWCASKHPKIKEKKKETPSVAFVDNVTRPFPGTSFLSATVKYFPVEFYSQPL